MNVVQISGNAYLIQAKEPDYRGFGTVSYTDYGTSYNAYLMDTGDGFASFGSLPERYHRDWAEEIRSIAGNSLKWAVFFGKDQDRSAAMTLLEQYPGCTVIGGENGIFQLQSGMDRLCNTITIRDHRNLTLGGTTIRFRVLKETYSVPGIYAFDDAGHMLLTADAFGSVMASRYTFVSDLKNTSLWKQAAALYCKDIFAEFRQVRLRAMIDEIKASGIQLICPSSGLLVDTALNEMFSLYDMETRKAASLAIIYAPGGYTSDLAALIASGVRESGITDIISINLGETSRQEALNAISGAGAFLFGASEVQGDGAKSLWDILTSLDRRNCQGNPDKRALDNAWEYGFNFGCALQKIPNPRKPVLVKCLVCGEIFEASLGACPVCGVGLDQCVSVEADDTGYRRDTEEHFLILGGGVAAVAAAEAIRLRNKTCTIDMLSREDYLPINRPMLTKDFETAAANSNAIAIHDQTWYDDRNIQLHLGVCAEKLDADLKTVQDSNGVVYPYDKLIYAAGAECFVPPFSGHDKDGVITLRHLWDSKKLKEYLDSGAKTAVVIGGGVLGLEAANELMRSGVRVTVLEVAPQIIGRQVDTRSASMLKEKMEKLGVACMEGVTISAIEGEQTVTGVRLDSGQVLPADFVIVSCGNRANVSIALEAGINVDRAIVVNERMETNLPDIYACGDCCQFENVNYQLWQEASNQGRVAGANAAGETEAYANQLLGLSLEGFGISLFAIGDPGKQPDVPYKTVETVDHVRGAMETYWFSGGSLQGAVAIGTPEKTIEISTAVTTHTRHNMLF